MVLNLVQLVLVYGLGFFLIKESRILTKRLVEKESVIWLYRFMFLLGIAPPIVASVIFIERYM